MEDMGFGEMFPASHKIWEEAFSLKEKTISGRKGIGYEQESIYALEGRRRLHTASTRPGSAFIP